jgi:hypothetical protein
LQRLHQIAADHEEDVDPEEAGAEAADLEVEEKNDRNRNGAEDLDVRFVGSSPLNRHAGRDLSGWMPHRQVRKS